ncbi:MAG: hypothetical protein M5R41_07820 [Bacteroidia bacterium]|nr:hypothetical protein [Bacteroidia bacterium]
MMYSTYDRHRKFLLTRMRAKRLRRQAAATVLIAGTGILVCLLLLPMLIGDPAYTTAQETANALVSRAFRGTTELVDELYRSVQPAASEHARNEALALFPHHRSHARAQILSAGIREWVWPRTEDGASHRALDVLLIGTDNRIGERRGRADALQLISIDIDTRSLTIMGIPRGTPTDLGYDSAAWNILANVLPLRGREALLRRVAHLTGRDSIRYWMEFGFSDAMGVLEILGYRDPDRDVRMLRRREGYRYGDHTRSYVQASFIGNSLRRVLPLLGEAMGELVISQGLQIVKSNLNIEQCHGLALLLRDAGVAERPELIHVRVLSPYDRHLARDARGAGPIRSQIPAARVNAERRIALLLARAARATEGDAVQLLWTPFQQHVWLQVPDQRRRRTVRDEMAGRLITALSVLGRTEERDSILRMMQAEDALYSMMGKVRPGVATIVRP